MVGERRSERLKFRSSWREHHSSLPPLRAEFCRIRLVAGNRESTRGAEVLPVRCLLLVGGSWREAVTQGTDPRTCFFDRYPSYCRGTYDSLGRGTSGFCRSFPIVLSFPFPSVHAIPFQTSRRHWKRQLRHRLQERSSSPRLVPSMSLL